MIPVHGLDDVRVAWVEIQAEGYILHGFLLYSDNDDAFVEYMRSGLEELDYLSGEDCAIFVIESPSERWIAMAQSRNHPWWRLFGSQLLNLKADSQVVGDLLKVANRNLVHIGNGQTVSLDHLLGIRIGELYNRSEVWRVAKHFGLQNQDVPCITFFRDLDDTTFHVLDLTQIRTKYQATRLFRRFFDSAAFKQLLEEASQRVHS